MLTSCEPVNTALLALKIAGTGKHVQCGQAGSANRVQYKWNAQPAAPPGLQGTAPAACVYSARIESNCTYALLDEHGRFKVRNLFDTRSEEDAAHA